MVESKFKRRNDIEEEGKIVRLNSDSAHYKIRLDQRAIWRMDITGNSGSS